MRQAMLIGIAGGQRAMTPLAVIAGRAYDDGLPPGADRVPVVAWLARRPLAVAGAVALAALEMAGDKMRSAPDRTVPVGLVARAATSAYAGAVLGPDGRRAGAAALAAVVALLTSAAGLRLRRAAMRRAGQTATGFAEDAAVLALALAATRR